jgi:outer membrane protein assembly factor BamA
VNLRGLGARTRRGFLWGAGFVLILLMLAVAMLETSPGRAALLRWALEAVEARTGLTAQAEGLDIVFLRREVRVRGLRLAAPGAPPLVRAAEMRLAWSLVPLGRGLVPVSVEVEGLRIELRRGDDGAWNLPRGPRSTTGPGAPTLPLRISLRHLAVLVSDGARGFEASAGGISLEAEGSRLRTTASLSFAEPLRWRIGRQTGELALTPARFQLGRSLSLKPWSARASEGGMRLEGTWSDVYSAGGLDLSFDADLDLGRLAARIEPPAPVVGGVHVAGRIRGTGAEPRAEVTWRGNGVRAAGRPVGLAGGVTITGKDVALDRISLQVAGGTIEGAGRIAFAETEASRIAVRWSALDPGVLFAPKGEGRAALLAGSLHATWPGLEARRAQGQATLEAHNGEQGSVPFEGRARLDLEDLKWTLEANGHSREDAQFTGQLEGRLGSARLDDTTVAGRLELVVQNLAPLKGAGETTDVAGRARGSMVVSGTLGSPRAVIDLRGQGLSVGQSPPADLTAQGVIDSVALRVDAFELHAGSAHAQAAGRVLLANGGLDGRYAVDLPHLAALSSVFPKGVDPAGTLQGHGSLGGTWQKPKATLMAQGTDLQIAGQSMRTGRLELRLDGPELRADAFELTQPSGALTGKGTYDRAAGRFRGSLHGRGFLIGALPAGLTGAEALPIGGRLDVDLEAAGTTSAPDGRGRVSVVDGTWKGRSLGPLSADLTLTREGLHADLRGDALRAQAEATIGLAPPRAFLANARLDGSDIEKAAQLLGLDDSVLAGKISLTAKATGSIDDLGQSAVDLEGSLEGHLGDLAGIPAEGAPAGKPSPPRVGGALEVSFGASGPLAGPTFAGKVQLRDGSLRFPAPGRPERPPLEHVSADASLAMGTLRLDRLDGTWSGASFTASGEVTGSFLRAWLPTGYREANAGASPRAALHARLEGDAGSVLAAFSSEALKGSGRPAVLSVDLEADAPRPDAVRGEIRLEGADLQTSDVAIRQTAPALLRVQNGELTLEGATWSGPFTELRLIAKATMGPKDDPFQGAVVDAELSGNADLRLAQTVTRGIETGGSGQFRLKVTGKPAALRTVGEVELHDGMVRHRPTRMALDGLTGTLRWGPEGFEVEGLRGSLNGGALEAAGSLRRRDSGSGFEGSIRIQARNAFLEWPPGLRAGLRANLALEPADEGLRLAGTLRVQEGTYRTREYFSLQVLDVVDRFSGPTSSSPFDPLRLDLSLKSSQDVQLDAVDGHLAVGIDLKLTGSVGKPELGGRLTAAAGGQLFMSGRSYDLESAVLDFSRGAGFEPYVQARASTRVSDYTILADVAGPATRVQTRFASTPPLGQQDIVTLLTSGRTVGSGGSGSGTDALSMASGGMLGKTGRVLGLDSLKIDSHADFQGLDFDPTAVGSEADPASRLTFSKRLAANLSATFSRSLTKTGSYTWFVAWKPRPSLEVRVVQRDDQTGALEFRHDLTIGGGRPVVAPPRRRRRRRSGEIVSTVRITGDTEMAHLSDLRLREGQPFDYERWLEDRDRLEGGLAKAGYREGRVFASRETATPGAEAATGRRVALVYDVRRGARTTLTLEGIPAPAALRERIGQAWQTGDFASSIEDEARSLARAHLYDRGFLRGRVEAQLRSSPENDTKTLSVRAEPGRAVTSRSIAFEGNVRVPREQLQALVRDEPRARAAWLRPEDLRVAVLGVYAREGLLAAKVEVHGPTFAGDEALLTVRIDEGPVVPIREIAITGAEHLAAPAILAAAGLREGEPFKPAAVEAAKAGIEAAYRSLGYNGVTVRSRGDLDAASETMKVELQVEEGRREMLAEVAVEGVSPDEESRLRRRLGLPVGAPVILDEWTEARRRLYETGLYRRVDLESAPAPSAAHGGDGPQPIQATLRVEKWPALRLRYGLQALTGGKLAAEEGRKDLQVGAVAEVSRQTLFGRAASIGLSTQVRKEDQEARAYLSLPRTFGTPVRSSLFLTVTPEHVVNDTLGGKVDIRKTELTWEERIRATRKLDLAAAYKFQWNRFTFGQPVEGLASGDRLDISLARLVGTALFDTRNDLIDTSRGSFTSASVEWGGDAVGSDFPLTRTFFQQFAYLPAPGGMVFGAAARAERASGQGSAFLDTDRLQAGGANTVRGFADDALTSRSVINFLGGSTTLLVLNGELRFPVHGPIRGVLFGDGALSWAGTSEETIRESIWSAGLGLRYVTPVGILRLDYGIPLDDGWKPGRGRVYFSLGQVF